jgi:hypothetical protein
MNVQRGNLLQILQDMKASGEFSDGDDLDSVISRLQEFAQEGVNQHGACVSEFRACSLKFGDLQVKVAPSRRSTREDCHAFSARQGTNGDWELTVTRVRKLVKVTWRKDEVEKVVKLAVGNMVYCHAVDDPACCTTYEQGPVEGDENGCYSVPSLLRPNTSSRAGTPFVVLLCDIAHTCHEAEVPDAEGGSEVLYVPCLKVGAHG